MTVYEYFNILFPILRMITRRREILIIPQRRYFTLFYVSLLITVMNVTEKFLSYTKISLRFFHVNESLAF